MQNQPIQPMQPMQNQPMQPMQNQPIQPQIQQPQQAVMTYMPVMTMMPQQQQQILPPAIPGAPPTLVVDTSPQAMEEVGFEEIPSRPRNMNQRPGRSTTRKRVQFTNTIDSQQQQQGGGQDQKGPNVRVTIQKLG
jgi:hypothetical protein